MQKQLDSLKYKNTITDNEVNRAERAFEIKTEKNDADLDMKEQDTANIQKRYDMLKSEIGYHE